ncbi:MAG: AAA family ATPase [Acidimicrobiales bacterium]
MRPVRLELEGFGAFRERTVVDFADLDLVAFVGPTGSGKSTVIDALTFALYGSVARYDNTSLVAPAIHQLATEAKVRFDFELSGIRYVAVRVVRRTKSASASQPRATTREARLERVDDETTTVLAGNVRELDQEVRQLLGLDFGQFTRTIVLPQGDFAEFLTDDPGNRQKLLRQLLDIDVYARMGTVARERAARARQRAEVYHQELERLVDVTPETVGRLEGRVTGLDELADRLRERLEELAALDGRLDRRRAEVVEIDRRVALLGSVEPDAELGRSGDNIAGARAAAEEAASALTAARRRRAEAADEREAAGEVASWRQLLDLRRQLLEIEAEIVHLTEAHAEAVTARAAIAAATAEADGLLADATRQLSEARAGADVAVWTAKLVAGEPCPVCGTTVTDIPDHTDAGTLAELERSEELARDAVRAATAAEARAEARVGSLTVELSRRRAAGDDLAGRCEAAPAEAELGAALARAEAAAVAERAAAGELSRLEEVAAASARRLAAVQDAEADLRRRFSAQRDVVAELGPPPAEGTTLGDDWAALARWAVGEAGRLAAARVEAAADGRELAASKAVLVTSITDDAAALGVEAGHDEMASAVAAARATAAAEAARQRERLEHRNELTATAEQLDTEHLVNDTLGRQHLSASGFERWILAEALDDIVERATVRLLELSNARYSLEAVDGSFFVRDHANADERRDVRTLSGGEIFLASLALALALAESIAELAPVDGPRLESIFLDEGFGTLDGETLDVLASAIEELSASGRLVAIVTHVRDLAERMPVRFEVRKGPTTSTIDRVER